MAYALSPEYAEYPDVESRASTKTVDDTVLDAAFGFDFETLAAAADVVLSWMVMPLTRKS